MNRQQKRAAMKQLQRNNQKARECNKPITDAKTFFGNIAMQRLQRGTADANDIKFLRNSEYAHMDNEVAAPNGTKCKLNVEAIQSRPQSDLTDNFKNWIEEHKDEVFTITREGSKKSLICLEEDTTEPKWLFDLYSDLLIFDAATDSYLPLETISAREEEEVFTGVADVPEIVDENQEEKLDKVDEK